MIRSMTGYGRFEGLAGGRQTIFEIKAVNHRFLEVQCRLPKGCGFLEEAIKEMVAHSVFRGKVDIYVSIEANDSLPANVHINHGLAAGYVKALRELRDTYDLKDDISVSLLAHYADIFTVTKAPENEEALVAIVREAGEKAIGDFLVMREREGAKLAEDILAHGQRILTLVDEIDERSPITVEEYRQKLYERLTDVLKDTSVDPQRLLTEAAIFADKTAVNEETVRLKSHYAQLEALLQQSEPVGRKLDFIVQEMNREANTTGSKVCDAALAHKVVEIKAEIEKMREQIQNIE